MAPTEPRAYEFGPYRLEPGTRRLLKRGAPVPLTPKAFDILLALLERRDRVVDKAELMKLVWPDSFVEDANLSQTIFVLRKTLGEAQDRRVFIETVPRRGYRFAAAVTVVTAEPASAPAPPAKVSASPLRASWIAASLLLVAALGWAGTAWMPSSDERPDRIESIVVLPFADLSDSQEQELLADSLTDALITKLGQIGGLRVISRTSAMTYGNTSKTVPQIARELNVDAVVEGSVQRLGDRVRLNLKLIDAPADRTVWAESYERRLEESLDLHNDIARAIVSRTGVTLTASESERLALTTRVDPRAYEAYLKGRYFWNRRSEPDMRQAIAHFEEAIRHDGRYAPAYAGLADSYALFGSYGWSLPGRDAWPRAVAAAEQALALDGDLADGHTSRARIALNYEMDWARTEEGYRRALQLNPGYANAHHWYGYYLLLTGRIDEGQAEIRRALELDPLSPIINANVGIAYYFGREYDAAIRHWQSALDMHRNYRLLHLYLTSAYLAKRKYPEAIAEIEKARALSGAGSAETALLAHAYGRMGRGEEARALVAQVVRDEGDSAAYDIALAYVGLGLRDEALEWLDRSVELRMGPFNELNADPLFDPLRGDPRFASLVRRVGLGAHGLTPTIWKK